MTARRGGPARRSGRARPVSDARRVPLDPPALRLAERDDLAACAEIWRVSIGDYLARLNQPDVVTDLAPVRRLLAHLLTTDPGSFWVATRPAGEGAATDPTAGARDARIVGFASANVRGRAWFLGMLFVAPPEQRQGLGVELLERTLPAAARPATTRPAARGDDGDAAGEGWTFGTVADSAQPISNALYARFGLVPRVPLLHLAGDVRRPRAFPALPRSVEAVRFEDVVAGGGGEGVGHRDLAAAVGDVDRDVLGYDRPVDHAYLRREGRVGFLYRTGGGVVGYGYTSRAGRVGPIAVREAALLPAVLGDVLAAVPAAGAFSTWVPGAAGDAVSVLLRAGFRLEPFPALHCWDRPSVDDSRYVPMSLALL